MAKQLKRETILLIMDRAMEINRSCQEECRDFRIMRSPMREDNLILRWTTINIDNIDNPVQCYRYECFRPDGTALHCSVHYADSEEANDFFWSLETLYHQEFACDHKLKICTTSKK